MLNVIYNVKLKSIIWGLVVGNRSLVMPWNTSLGSQLLFSTLFAAKHLLGLEK